MSGQNKEKSGQQFGAGLKLNGSVRYSRAFMLLFQPAQFLRLRRDSDAGQSISRSIANPLAVVDLAEECIKACQQRFAADSHISYYVNDGKSLAMIQDKSIDFVFSFDSLVHAEAEVIETYLNQLARKLSQNGVGFIHHSNLGKYQQALALIDKIPSEFRELVINRIFLASTHWRAGSMTAELFEHYCDQAGLHCISQELVNWGTEDLLIDCFSVFTPKDSIWARPNNVIENKDFMREAVLIQQLSRLYTLKSFPVSREINSFETHPVEPMPRESPKSMKSVSPGIWSRSIRWIFHRCRESQTIHRA